ncbi:MAG: hypothetical protein HY735_12440 [Verrucomicrobia bacterium]|nr:hypothetical protein [Verrucomicrobiota bacterium]
MRLRIARLFFAVIAAAMLTSANSALACAVCFGKSDSALAKGLHWGVLSLLAIVFCVLAGIASFFIYLAKRSASNAPNPLSVSQPAAETTHRL